MTSRYCCYLSTLATKETNAAAVSEYLSAILRTSGKAPVETDVFLKLEDHSRRTFLDHAQHLYNTALEHPLDISLSVIPVVAHGQPTVDTCLPLTEPPVAVAQPADTVVLLDKAAMQSSARFEPFYRYVAVGGTFDHLHSGHKLLLTTALLHTTDKLRVGITGPELLTKKKFAEELEPIEARKAGVVRFLQKIRRDVEFEVETISDVSGGTDRIAEVEALTTSPETEGALAVINELRAKNGITRPLVGIPIPYVQAADGRVISSTIYRERLSHKG